MAAVPIVPKLSAIQCIGVAFTCPYCDIVYSTRVSAVCFDPSGRFSVHADRDSKCSLSLASRLVLRLTACQIGHLCSSSVMAGALQGEFSASSAVLLSISIQAVLMSDKPAATSVT
jgi:hypothetical protein